MFYKYDARGSTLKSSEMPTKSHAGSVCLNFLPHQFCTTISPLAYNLQCLLTSRIIIGTLYLKQNVLATPLVSVPTVIQFQ